MIIKTKILSLLMLLVCPLAFSQNIDFKLMKAMKSNELLIDRTLESELLNEKDILPEGKMYLTIIADIKYSGEQPLRLGKEDVTIGKEKNKAVGYLDLSARGNLKWGYRGDLWPGKNYFSAIFIVDTEIDKTTLNIADQSFKITEITQSTPILECLPKVSIVEKEYLNEITFEDNYRRANNQTFSKTISPKNGKLLKLSLSIEFCENAAFFKHNSFSFEPTFFQLENSDGVLFSCLGTFFMGKFRKPSTFNILGQDSLKQDITLIFNVPSEGGYTLKYVNKEVSDF